jgi:hypothetical protein
MRRPRRHDGTRLVASVDRHTRRCRCGATGRRGSGGTGARLHPRTGQWRQSSRASQVRYARSNAAQRRAAAAQRNIGQAAARQWDGTPAPLGGTAARHRALVAAAPRSQADWPTAVNRVRHRARAQGARRVDVASLRRSDHA